MLLEAIGEQNRHPAMIARRLGRHAQGKTH